MPVPLHPDDTHDAALLARLKPTEYRNPTPKKRYQLVVIGAGPAGLVAAAGAAGLGASVALIERDLMGGDCLTVGCVPSKTLLRSAHAAHDSRTAEPFGISSSFTVNFPEVMQRVRRVRAGLSQHDSVERFTNLGVDVFLGEGKFVSQDAVEVAGTRLSFSRCLIATGARPKVPEEFRQQTSPPIYTNESIFNITQLPQRLLVIGAGPVGCELSQAFARLGSQVTLVARKGILERDDHEAATFVAASLKSDGVVIQADTPSLSQFDAVLVAAGRMPNIEQLNLDAAGIESDSRRGIIVDDYLRTTNSRIFAAGDVSSIPEHFTHAADAMARIVVQNALFPIWSKVSRLIIPHCTFTDPELAHIGQSTNEGECLKTQFLEMDRGATDSAPGFIKIRIKPGSDAILGATVVGPRAGEIISSIAIAMNQKIGLKQIAKVVFPYPTYGEAFKKIADQYSRSRLTPRTKWLLSLWLRWFR